MRNWYVSSVLPVYDIAGCLIFRLDICISVFTDSLVHLHIAVQINVTHLSLIATFTHMD